MLRARASAADSAAEDPMPEPTGIMLSVENSSAWSTSLVRYLRWGCLLKSMRSPLIVLYLESRTAMVILRSTARTTAGLP